MCLHGGFNLHKCTSIEKEVTQEIPVIDTAEDVKNLDVDREVPLMECLVDFLGGLEICAQGLQNSWSHGCFREWEQASRGGCHWFT